MTIAFDKVRLGQPAATLGVKSPGRDRLARAIRRGSRLCADRVKILLVEDDGDTAFALSMLLGVEGFEVVRAGNVTEAYDDALAVAPDLVITDIEMPMLTGLDLIRLFKQNPRLVDIPIIAMSALARSRLQLARASGAVAVYQKPLDYERLIAAIKSLLPRSGLAVAGKRS
jgi:CheY-like chemotaxis protein